MKIICGLGNPGKKYENSRHNIGFMFIDALAHEFNSAEFKEKWDTFYCEADLNDEKVILLKPLTFMNLSGRALKKFADFYKIAPENIIVVYDDVDLPLGEIRFKKSGSAGTHNGMKSVIQELGTQDFPRLRIGIESRGASAPAQMDLADFVLASFLEEESELVKESIKKSLDFIKNSLA